MQQVEKVIAVVAMLTGVLGAISLATAYSMILGYQLFLISSVLWMAYSIRTVQRELFYTNAVFTVINLIGLVTYLGK